MIKITYFVHGTTTDNEQGISSGWKDAELSELGAEQAHKLRELTKDMQFDVVLCSDLKRAHETAKIAFGDRFPVVPMVRLRECNYGDLNGGPSDVVEPMQEKLEKFPNGESYKDVEFRINDLLQDIKKQYDGKRVAIVSHKAPQLALDVLLKKKTWQQALAEDWRKKKAWHPGWEYQLR